MKPPFPWITGVEAVLNHYLSLDPQAGDRLAGLAGKVICLHVEVLDWDLYAIPGAAGIQVLGSYDGQADTTLRGSPLALMRLGLGEGNGALLKGEVVINGDVEVGGRFREILAGLDVDWEEQLARVVGDLPAHLAGNALRAMRQWTMNSWHKLGLDTAEYLQEEQLLLPAREELEAWLAAIDTLRDDAARLEARVRRLQAQLEP